MSSSRLVELLFSGTRRQLLALLLLHPERTFHVREVARLTGLSAGSLHRELRLLEEAGLLLRSEVGNQVHYRADRECPIFPELSAIFRKTVGLAGVLHEALSPLGEGVELAFIFGSIARGEERRSSDVDLFIVGDADFVEVVKALSDCHERVGREINPVVMTRAAWTQKGVAGDRFVSRVMREPKIFVKGDANDLGKLVEDGAAEGSRHGP